MHELITQISRMHLARETAPTRIQGDIHFFTMHRTLMGADDMRQAFSTYFQFNDWRYDCWINPLGLFYMPNLLRRRRIYHWITDIRKNLKIVGRTIPKKLAVMNASCKKIDGWLWAPVTLFRDFHEPRLTAAEHVAVSTFSYRWWCEYPNIVLNISADTTSVYLFPVVAFFV